MKTIITESLKNIESYMKAQHKGYWGMMSSGTPGAIAKIMTNDRCYFMTIVADDNLEKVFLDIHPQCVCEKPYRQMVHGYVNSRTSNYKSGRIDIDDDSGEVKIRIETQISDHPVTEEDLKDMECLAVQISDGIERRLDKLCHGVWFREDDPELMGSMERRHKERIAEMKKRASLFGDDPDDDDLSESGDDSDEGDDEEDSPSDFLKLMQMLRSMPDDDNGGGAKEPIEGEYSEKTAPKEKRYKLYLTDVSGCADTETAIETFGQALGMTKEESLAAMENCPCCIAESAEEAEINAIKTQLDGLGMKTRIEIISDT